MHSQGPRGGSLKPSTTHDGARHLEHATAVGRDPARQSRAQFFAFVGTPLESLKDWHPRKVGIGGRVAPEAASSLAPSSIDEKDSV